MMPATHRIEVSVALALATLGLVLLVLAPAFFEPGNLLDVLLGIVPVALVAVGATLVILTGEIDISVGSVFAVSSVLAGVLAVAGLPVPLVALLTLLAGAALGAVNGALVAFVALPSIVVTLATMVAWRDGLRWATQGAWVQDLPVGFQWFGLSQGAYPALAVAVVAGVYLCAAWALTRLPAGRAVHATGSNAEAAWLVGISPSRVRFCTFALAGACTALAALLNAVRFSQVPANAGIGLEMQVIAAVVVGGTAITGGRGSMGGTLLGVVLLGVLGPALTFLGVDAAWERALQGFIILSAVAMDAVRARRAAARAPRRVPREASRA